MIMGLCGSFAVVPAFSLATLSSSAGETVHHAPSAGNNADHPVDISADTSLPADPTSLAAVLLSDIAAAAWSAPVPPAASGAAPAPAASVPAPVTAPAAATAPPAPVVTPLPTPSVSPVSPLPAIVWPPLTLLPLTLLSPPTPAAAPPTPPPTLAPQARLGGFAASAPTGSSRVGQATWLDTIPTGTCASNDARMGTVLTVTNSVGVSVTCKVVSTGPFVPGRIIDLAKATFAALCPVSAGVAAVNVRW